MKIRTDFVTNSSSSSYVTIVVDTKDDRHFCGAFTGDDVGNRGVSLTTKEFTLKDALNAENGKELLTVLDKAFDGLFSEFWELDSLFEEYCKGGKDRQLRMHKIKYPVGNQEEFEKLPVSEISSMKVYEETGGDYGDSDGTVTLDFVNQKETLEYHVSYKDYKEIRDYKTGKVKVTKNKVIGGIDYDY